MRIGIIGSGKMGRTLGKLWSDIGHDVLFGSRDPSRVDKWIDSNGVHAKSGTYSNATGFGDVVLLSTIWSDTKSAIQSAGSLEEKILIDCTNPEDQNEHRLVIGFSTSGAEEIEKWASGAKVVKAFNHIYGTMLEVGSQFGSQNASIFYCGNDLEAKKVVADLAREIGLDPVDAGELRNARYVEPLAGLWVQLARVKKWGGENIGLKFLHR